MRRIAAPFALPITRFDQLSQCGLRDRARQGAIDRPSSKFGRWNANGPGSLVDPGPEDEQLDSYATSVKVVAEVTRLAAPASATTTSTGVFAGKPEGTMATIDPL